MAVASEKNVDVEVNLYLKTKPGRDELTALVAKLVDPVEDLVRKDSHFKQLGLDAADYVGNAGAVIDLLVQQPRLLQRPIVEKGDKAIIGRPKDRVAQFLAD